MIIFLIGTVVALSFLFAFGNVWALGIKIGVPMYVASLVAPAVDLSVIAGLLATRELAQRGANAEQIRPVRRLLLFASLVTLALNVAEPLIIGEYGKATFDNVGSLLLVGWSEDAIAAAVSLNVKAYDVEAAWRYASHFSGSTLLGTTTTAPTPVSTSMSEVGFSPRHFRSWLNSPAGSSRNTEATSWRLSSISLDPLASPVNSRISSSRPTARNLASFFVTPSTT
nr:hypothetical protein [Protofrankia symbiont of Coriaria ruscifolia]